MTVEVPAGNIHGTDAGGEASHRRTLSRINPCILVGIPMSELENPNPDKLQQPKVAQPPTGSTTLRRSGGSRFQLAIAAVAAFSTYFCMYAFRKPFTAATFDGQQLFGLELKSALVVSQLCGYMASKFIGIRVLAELPARRRAVTILALIGFAEVALVAFAYAPMPVRPILLFLNGLPLGMVFGIVLSYLEGRLQTEAMAAVLCSSFIISSGVVKSAGRWLIDTWSMNEFLMPGLVGGIFVVPLILSVFVLQRTPPPNAEDLRLRQERRPVTRDERWQLWRSCPTGLTGLIIVYIALTVIRTIRDDFGVEIWRSMGVTEKPSVFATTEIFVAVFASVLNGMLISIRGNLAALRTTFIMMGLSFLIVALSPMLFRQGELSPLTFMVTCGAGLYIPYVAFHTTVFERLVPLLRQPGNVVFLMYVADAFGYLGYSLVLTTRAVLDPQTSVLPLFCQALTGISVLAGMILLIAWINIRRTVTHSSRTSHRVD